MIRINNIKAIHDYTGLCVPSVLQKALVEYIKRYDFGKNYISEIRYKLKTTYNLLYKAVKQMGFTAHETDGGYFIWAKLPYKLNDGYKFAIDLYDDQKVAIIPGIHFSDKGKSYVRFNIAREENEVVEAILRIDRFLKD